MLEQTCLDDTTRVKARRSFRFGLGIGLCVGVVFSVASVFVVRRARRDNRIAVEKTYDFASVGVLPLLPTFCNTLSTSSEPFMVLVHVNGKPFAVVPDTGSSNFNLASSTCGEKCLVSPVFHQPEEGLTTAAQSVLPPRYEITYGTGAAVLQLAEADVTIGGLTLAKGSFGAIVDQHAGSDGFNLFPSPSDPFCYNTYAGILGLAYRGQDAGPGPGAANITTNGTTIPLLDQLVAKSGVPNAFALEICDRYPRPCGPRRDNSTWTPSRPCDVNYPVGNLYLGGYSSSSLSSSMRYTRISDEIHYDVVLLGIEVCGELGCQNVSFPNRIDGQTENDCVCHTQNCETPLQTDEYCFFSVLDSGADGIMMNTVNNTVALLNAMRAVGMAVLPPDTSPGASAALYNGTVLAGAHVSPKARFSLYFPDAEVEATRDEQQSFRVDVAMSELFWMTSLGLVQRGVQANLNAAAAFQATKFPVLIGGIAMVGRTTFFDRSRRRIGFADVKYDACGATISDMSLIDVRGLSGETPGAGCRRGTGSGGGCPQVARSVESPRDSKSRVA
eukprot:TRINITY_DN43585_c0_g1_i1.p1 TRINITY_DN43585_c0_g1~~TRINITY_DN43585_c0_g1_i1.p1  ORF type:complete len:558 (+),score=64.06 TRINITY_DN43585_c0_g1_i1:112-1785(+)